MKSTSAPEPLIFVNWELKSAETVTLCGKDCYGLFFSTHYAAAGATGATKTFIERYKAKYGYVPDDVAALTWDSLQIIKKAFQDTGGLTGNLKKDRDNLRVAMSRVKKFKGITGEMTFTEEGDPVKCAVIVKISDKGQLSLNLQEMEAIRDHFRRQGRPPLDVELETLAHGHTDGGFFYAANAFCTPEHGGTHLDAPIHFAAGRWTVDEIPIGRLSGPAVVIDVAFLETLTICFCTLGPNGAC